MRSRFYTKKNYWTPFKGFLLHTFIPWRIQIRKYSDFYEVGGRGLIDEGGGGGRNDLKW